MYRSFFLLNNNDINSARNDTKSGCRRWVLWRKSMSPKLSSRMGTDDEPNFCFHNRAKLITQQARLR